MKKILLILMAMFAFGIQNVSAQDAIKIVTGHPDLKFQIKRCVAQGKIVIIDMTITNNTENDIDVLMGETNCGPTVVYDSEGNTYDDWHKKPIKVGNKNFFENFRGKLISGVPVKVQLKIQDFSEKAESIARLDFMFWSDQLNLGCSHAVIIRNIPVTR